MCCPIPNSCFDRACDPPPSATAPCSPVNPRLGCVTTIEAYCGGSWKEGEQ
jgi:hypothetical protein